MKYTVSCGYVYNGGMSQAVAKPRTMSRPDLEFALAMIDPFLHGKWLSQIAMLRRRGDKIVLTTQSPSQEYGVVGRAIKIVRTT